MKKKQRQQQTEPPQECQDITYQVLDQKIDQILEKIKLRQRNKAS
jgi:hypothetical protein